MRRYKKLTCWLTCVALLTSTFATPMSTNQTQAGDWGNPFSRTTTVEELAGKIDRLEKHLDKYGTIVAKAPDVWGEARLTKHRQEFEEQFAEEIDEFAVLLNGAISRSDSAFLASATMISALNGGAVSPESVPTPPMEEESSSNAPAMNPPTPVPVDDIVSVITTVNGLLGSTDAPISDPSGTGTTGLVIRTATPQINPTFVDSTRTNGVTNLNIGIEPVARLDQMKRYIDHLNEIRRLNEGDDTADSPGYALHLVRIPVSVLPGKHTTEGYGAEITCSIRPHLGDELLPQTFRRFVINDLIEQSGLPLTKILELRSSESAEDQALYKLMEDTVYPSPIPKDDDKKTVQEIQKKWPGTMYLPSFGDTGSTKTKTDQTTIIEYALKLYGERLKAAGIDYDPGINDNKVDASLLSFLNRQLQRTLLAATGGNSFRDSRVPLPPTLLRDESTSGNLSQLARLVMDADVSLRDPLNGPANGEKPRLLDVQAYLKDELEAAYDFLSEPQAEILWQFAGPGLARAIRERRNRIAEQDISIQKLGREEYTGVPDPGMGVIWAEEARNGSKRLVNNQRHFKQNIEYYRFSFFRTIAENFPQAHDTTTSILAWYILVESSLLNEQLVKDMKDLNSAKNACYAPTDWMQYYGPNPPMEARMGFNQYVECRWPIHVFALDPITQDQNISDEFSRRTELQIALAISLSEGLSGPNFIGGNRFQQMLRFVRRLETDLATIDFNRTVVSFAHGKEHFGWRFYPRFQSQDTPSNLEAFFRDNLIGDQGKDRLLAERRLEPGMREVTALVVMPSFVPYASIDTRSNWFKLSHASKKRKFFPGLNERDPDLKDAMKLSRELTEIRHLETACVQDEHLYRPGDLYRLTRAVDQIEAKFPLQNYDVQLPYENTLGGFDMFNSGVTDLAPRLDGFYGAPGINVAASAATLTGQVQQIRTLAGELSNAQQALSAAPNATGVQLTTLQGNVSTARTNLQNAQLALSAQINPLSLTATDIYLVGKNFSVHETRVLAGGVDITGLNMELLSRNQMQVTIPATVNTVLGEDNRRYVDVHVATPYGTSNHLLVPVNDPTATEVQEIAELQESLSELQEELENRTNRATLSVSFKPDYSLVLTHDERKITKMERRGVTDADQKSSIAEFSSRAVPFGEKDSIENFQVAFYLKLPDAIEEDQIALGPFALDNKGKIIGRVDGAGAPTLDCAVNPNLDEVTRDIFAKLCELKVLEIDELKLQPYLRDKHQQQVVYKVGNEVTVPIEVRKEPTTN